LCASLQGTECTNPAAGDLCLAKCVNFDPVTGAVVATDCECLPDDQCHVERQSLGGGAVAGAPTCVVMDNGSGTISLPPEGCGYLGPDEFHLVLDQVNPGTTIEVAAEHRFFFCKTCLGGPNDGDACEDSAMDCGGFPCVIRNDQCSAGTPGQVQCETNGGSLGGQTECSESKMDMQMTGTGLLAGYNRFLSLDVEFETHTAPRTPFDPVQSFDTDMFGQRRS